MPDEAVPVLQEIAGLLRRRVEQTDEAAARAIEISKRSEERMVALDAKRSGMSEADRIRIDGEKRRLEMRAEMEQMRERSKEEKNQAQEEDRHFKQQLLAELQRHNSLLEQLLSRSSI